MDVKKVKRRGFLAFLSIVFSYILYRVAENNRWIIVTHYSRSYEPGTPPTPKSSEREISLLLVGDTGKPSEQRREVLQAIGQQSFLSSIDAVLLLGDNFYEEGVESVEDSKFESDFEKIFATPSFDCPFYPTLGNHDYAGNIDAQVEYSQRSERWTMPSLYYKVRRGTEGETLDLFVIDSNTVVSGKPEADEQLAWLDAELASSDATWKVVVGHHPCITGGEHGSSQIMQDRVGTLMTKHNVALYVAGHDHDLQLLDSQKGWLQVVSGSGSKIRSTAWIDSTEFAAARPGFAWLLINDEQLSVSFFDCDGHLFTRTLRTAAGQETELLAVA